MKTLSDKLYFNAEQFFQMQGLVHTYLFDKNNVVWHINELQLNIMQDIGFDKEDIIGNSMESILKNSENAAKIVCDENESVLTENKPKQFYNNWIAMGVYRIELLTTKMPVYNKEGKIYGVVGISQYIHKFSFSKALQLGLSIRETECLVLLLENKSSKQIAHCLNLSTRTVEHYIDNMKEKLNCSSKLELILKFTDSGFKEKYTDSISLQENEMIIYPNKSDKD